MDFNTWNFKVSGVLQILKYIFSSLADVIICWCYLKDLLLIFYCQIERIQNRTLYQQYSAKKKALEQQKTATKPIERQLWHGTMETNIPSIINNGFNRSYCGVNGKL